MQKASAKEYDIALAPSRQAPVGTRVDARVDAGLKVLDVDDDDTNRAVMEILLRKDGHAVCMARNGQEAVSSYETEQPDLVLMDVMMPVMNGYDAARMIKEIAGTHFVPIIFLTALTDEPALAKCLEVGGDDFLTKPVSRIILQAKMAAATRVRRLYLKLERQQHDLADHHERLRAEHELAERVFARMVSKMDVSSENIKCRQSPLSIANGDLVLVANTPYGGQRILLGDSTGHGLAAAIGAIPVSEIFYAMTRKGFGLREMMAEMNRKLHDTLPTGQFVAACVVDWHHLGGKVSIWNGGIPDALLVSGKSGDITPIPSRNLPLGIVGMAEMNIDIEVRDVDFGDRVYAYSDGVIEARNDDGDEFGQGRLEAVIRKAGASERIFESISSELDEFCGDRSQADDITLVEILCAQSRRRGGGADDDIKRRSFDRALALRLGPHELRTFDPIIIVKMIVNGVAALESHRSFLYTIILELYCNALDHGILGLDSAGKADPEGFSRYYDERERLLASLESGWIHIDIECVGHDDGGELIIQMEDSGKGFSVEEDVARPRAATAIGGRGIELVRSLCKSLSHDQRGNYVRAVYAW